MNGPDYLHQTRKPVSQMEHKNLFGLALSYHSAEETEVLPFHFGAVSLILPSWL